MPGLVGVSAELTRHKYDYQLEGTRDFRSTWLPTTQLVEPGRGARRLALRRLDDGLPRQQRRPRHLAAQLDARGASRSTTTSNRLAEAPPVGALVSRDFTDLPTGLDPIVRAAGPAGHLRGAAPATRRRWRSSSGSVTPTRAASATAPTSTSATAPTTSCGSSPRARVAAPATASSSPRRWRSWPASSASPPGSRWASSSPTQVGRRHLGLQLARPARVARAVLLRLRLGAVRAHAADPGQWRPGLHRARRSPSETPPTTPTASGTDPDDDAHARARTRPRRRRRPRTRRAASPTAVASPGCGWPARLVLVLVAGPGRARPAHAAPAPPRPARPARPRGGLAGAAGHRARPAAAVAAVPIAVADPRGAGPAVRRAARRVHARAPAPRPRHQPGRRLRARPDRALARAAPLRPRTTAARPAPGAPRCRPASRRCTAAPPSAPAAPRTGGRARCSTARSTYAGPLDDGRRRARDGRPRRRPRWLSSPACEWPYAVGAALAALTERRRRPTATR